MVGSRPGLLDDLERALASSLRETDIRGWYKDQQVIGIIFTEMTKIDEVAREKILFKVHNAVRDSLRLEWDAEIKTSLHLYPEDIDLELDRGFDLALYPELKRRKHYGKVSIFFKRLMDVVGSLVALSLLLPLFLFISLAIKINSRGPILFRQKRLGLHGCQFTLLKFRSMHIDCGEKMHKDYIKQFICEQRSAAAPESEGEPEIYKLRDDPRITTVGKFLRKTSLDELPQFLNVLKGEMSLVGPRPPIPYEFEFYDVWHRRRLLEVKPGITGLWQV
jgi:lipopolysaccharide/colanic/teichoic acid biosynthesis glycosyltransferase